MKEEQIFHEALEVVAERRAAVLDEACGQDIDLRRRVEILLEAHANPGSFLGSPPPAVRVEQTLNQPSLEKRGTQVGPYKLLEQIGEGGFGVVYMAEQVTPVRRKVALKIIKPGMDTRQVIARFEAERQALSLMDHPNIAKVLDAGTTDSGRPYFVMELVKGQPITHYCDEKLLTPRQRLELLLPVCHAIQHAHQKGIIHRDIKPTNILVAEYDQQPVPKVIDFGVAKATGLPLSEKTMFTGFGQIVGTLEYMSPEQAKVNQLDIDTRSDIYSLGVLLYELLTGATPFDKERLRSAAWDEMLRIIREEEPPRPSTKLSSSETLPSVAANRSMEPARLSRIVRGDLDWIVMKALEKDRNRRYETANGFAMDVQRYLADEPVQACPPSTAYRLRKFVRRNKGPVLAAALVALALVGGIIGTAWGLIRATDAAGQKTVALREARDNLWLSLYEQARARRFSRQMGQRLDSLDALTKAAAIRADVRLRDAAIAAMALPDVRLGPTWHAVHPDTAAIAFGGEYRHYARASTSGAISIRTVPDDQEVRQIPSGPIAPGYLCFSPDERFLLGVGRGDAVGVWRVADGRPVLRDRLYRHFGHAFSPDGRRLAVGQNDWVRCVDLATGQEVKRWRLPSGVFSLAFHPDGDRLAVGYENSSFASVYDATKGELVANLAIGVNERQEVAWHPDGERLAVAGSDPRIQIWNVPAKRKVATLEGHVQQVVALSFHPDGSLLASGSWDGSLRLWDPTTGRQLLWFSLAVSLPPVVAGGIRFSGDGRWLGFTMHGEQAQLLEVTPTPEYRTLVSRLGAGQGTYGLDSDISPDGRLLALSTGDRVRLWHLPSGREMAVLPDGRPLFQSNGELLIAGPGGLHRWPIQPGTAANELRLGPPRVLALPAVPQRAARSQDSRTLAIVSETGGTALLVDLATDSVRAPRFNHASAGFVALSRDGRWLATSGWHSDRVRLWNAETGKMVQEWVLGAQLRVFFMPDNRVLIISRGDEFSFHDVQTLKPIRRIRRDVAQYPGHVAFSPDGKLMALEMAPGIIHLKDAATDRTVARLEDPHGDRSGWMGFTPDGTQLVVNAPFAQAVHIWDLRAIRQRLKGMGLDWDWPEFPPTAAKDALPALVKIEAAHALAKIKVDPAPRDAWFHLNLGVALRQQGKFDEAIACYQKAIELDPRFAQAHNNLAWLLATAPDAKVRNPARAVELAKRAVELATQEGAIWNTLGAAHYRAGDWKAAIAAFEKSMELRQGGDSFDWFFLAMAHWQLGEKDEAREWHDRAVQWMDKNQSDNKELRRFRAEAEELLGKETGGRKQESEPNDP